MQTGATALIIAAEEGKVPELKILLDDKRPAKYPLCIVSGKNKIVSSIIVKVSGRKSRATSVKLQRLAGLKCHLSKRANRK